MTHPFGFDNSFAREMAGFYVAQSAEPASAPRLLLFNEVLADRLGLDLSTAGDAAKARLFSGQDMPDGAEPLAQVYAGHQFGGFSPRLGDGRALLIGEVVAPDGQRFDIQLKGSGKTPFSRGGDGKSALGPVLREYLVSEAMHALGVPTTRALAAVATGDWVFRDDAVPGGIMTRVAASHLRVGSFQYVAARGETERVRQLADYAMRRHFPGIAAGDYLAFYRAVMEGQAALIARWMQIGFIHGVMNTDNMSISGETIDYGPCAFMDAYDPRRVFSSIDETGRYAFANQPLIGQWNLARLGEALIDLVDPDQTRAVQRLTEALETFPPLYEAAWLSGMRRKLGLVREEDGDEVLVRDLLAAMQRGAADFTLAFRHLSSVVRGDDVPFLAQFNGEPSVGDWMARYRQRLADDGAAEDRAAAMDRTNPLLIPRNHVVEAVLDAAVAGDMAPYRLFLDVLADPFTNRPGIEDYVAPSPGHDRTFRTFCGT